MFQNDQPLKTINIDLSQINLVDVTAQIKQANEVDDTFGFGNIIEDAIKDKLFQNQKKEGTQKDSDTNFNPQDSNYQTGEDGMRRRDPGYYVTAISPCKEGFLLGVSGGLQCFYEIENFHIIKETYSKPVIVTNAQNYQINGPDKKFLISNLSVNNNDSLTSIILSNGKERLYYILNIFQLDSEISPIQPFFPCGFHSNKINSIGISRCRSIFATVGTDNSIRLWTYEIIDGEEKKGILFSPNQENPVSISVHPYGFFIAVAFVSGYFFLIKQIRFKVYTLLNDNFYLLKETNQIQCNNILFSHGGQYLLTSSFLV